MDCVTCIFLETGTKLSNLKDFFSIIDSGTTVQINYKLNLNNFSLQEYQVLDRFFSELRSNLVI